MSDLSDWDQPWSVELVGGTTVTTTTLGDLVTVEGAVPWAMNAPDARLIAQVLLRAAAATDGYPPVMVDLSVLVTASQRLGVSLADLAAALGFMDGQGGGGG